MKLKIVFFIAALAVTAMLFAGLPEQTVNTSAQHASMSKNIELERAVVNELQRIRMDYSRLQSEMVMLKAEMKRRGMVHETGATRDDGAAYRGQQEDASGITIYLDTSNNAAVKPDKQWTAVSVRNAGVAEDGSQQAVVSIGKSSLNRSLPENNRTGYLKARWQ